MDGPNYPANIINSSTAPSASYPSLAAITPNQLLHQASALPPHSLPPLQQNTQAMQSGYGGSYPHTPRSATTPNTPGPNNNMASYPPPPPQNGNLRSYQALPNHSYPQAPQPYPTTSSMLPQTSTAASHPQPIAPAPSAGGRVPQVLRPMPPAGMPQQGLNSPYAQSPMMPQPPVLSESDQPTHVVGSQGRRGILPSAPGRPAAPAPGSTPAKAQVPQKDADGKFPCPHCTKTYLHAKHLKRHLLRHTGDRPYMCVLCRDTFSRSDILKRHFQKCSIRRGNPQGVSHLSHPQAHVKKGANAQKAGNGIGADGDVNHLNGMGNMSADGTVPPFGLLPEPNRVKSEYSDQYQMSTSSDIARLVNDRLSGNASGPHVAVAEHENGAVEHQNGEISDRVAANINPQLANYSMPPQQNGIPMFGGANANQQSGLDWSQMFETKSSPAISGDTSAEFTTTPHFPFIRDVQPVALTQLSTELSDYLSSGSTLSPSSTTNLSDFVRPANVREFLSKYAHFHAHFPFIHMPTFDVKDAFIGLVASMCCIGACYSSSVSLTVVREMMDLLSGALSSKSHLLQLAQPFLKTDSGARMDRYSKPSSTDLEDLLANFLCLTLDLWNGTSQHRARAQARYPAIARVARAKGLLQLSTADMEGFSPLHQSDVSSESLDPSSFNWECWVLQECKLRLMHSIFLCDTALGLYFNMAPQFNAFEVDLPLPADDAAWEASTAKHCAEALGLYGPSLATQRNPNGSQRLEQPRLKSALKALLHSSYDVQPGVTNLYGKFILVHGLLSLLRAAQVDTSTDLLHGQTSPLPLQDWLVGGASTEHPVTVQETESGFTTPVAELMAPDIMVAYSVALQKFKSNWDLDMLRQFPPSAVDMPRRYGFCRDGIHFYWLATFLLQNTKPVDLQTPSEQRFVGVITLLKSVREWVRQEGAIRGELAGSVGDIDETYGMADLTLGMAQLFAPLPQVVDSTEVSPVRIGSSNLTDAF